jgi:T5SS/PEP-CTERM-associated repeat protein
MLASPHNTSRRRIMPLPADTRIFTGLGQAGDWSDPMNWNGDVAATLRSIVLVPVSAVLNGSFTARQLMFLGDETVTVNGVLTTRSNGPCKSFMVCAHAIANFTPTSTLNDDGGLIVGAISVGTLIAQGDAAMHSTLNSETTKIGEKSDGVGSVTIDGAQWQNSQNFYVGLAGQGTLDVLHGGSVSVGTSFVVGDFAGASGSVSLASGATLSVGSYAKIGGGSPGVAGGTGTMAVGAGSVFSVAGPLKIASGSSLSLSGGSVSVADGSLGLQIWGGAAITGFGTVAATAGGINDAGTITAAGGTLTLDGDIAGKGVIQIEAGSTLAVKAATIGKAAIDFAGSGATLELAHGVTYAGSIGGFGFGDSIVMNGVNGIAWNAATDVLTLSHSGSLVDTLQFAGTYTGDPFTLTQNGATALIGFKG